MHKTNTDNLMCSLSRIFADFEMSDTGFIQANTTLAKQACAADSRVTLAGKRYTKSGTAGYYSWQKPSRAASIQENGPLHINHGKIFGEGSSVTGNLRQSSFPNSGTSSAYAFIKHSDYFHDGVSLQTLSGPGVGLV